MIAIIPAKASSLRIPNKNFRPFAGDQSLVDITIEKLLKLFPARDIYLSCEDESKRKSVERWGVKFLPRDPALCENDAPFYDWFNEVCNQVPGEDDVAWCHVTDPLFNGHAQCLDLWKRERAGHDSLVVVYPHRKHLLDADHNPIGFGFGAWHKVSQKLPYHYEMAFTLSILTRESVKAVGYHIGRKPLWYHATNRHVDIDTPEEFQIAGQLYQLMFPDHSVSSAKLPYLTNGATS